jgi:deazaflavin-dependent oxidoreductase (nitroreductase family)
MMTKIYKVSGVNRFFNRLLSFFIRLGVAPGQMYVMSVRGRKSGNVYSTPVLLLLRNNKRYVVSPYGEMNWVKNARATGAVKLSRGRHDEMLGISELSSQEAAPILKQYLTEAPMPRPYFTAAVDAPVEDFQKEAPAHPVFELVDPKP